MQKILADYIRNLQERSDHNGISIITTLVKDLQYNVDARIRAEASYEHDIADPAIKEYKKVMNEEYAINCT